MPEAETKSHIDKVHLKGEQYPSHGRTVAKLVFVVIGMFAFGFALVPLYDVFCDIAGINGKTGDSAAVYKPQLVDESRLITVDFITRTNGGMPWEFSVQTKSIEVHPGKLAKVDFYVKNPATRDIVAQAIPSISPGKAALYMNKTECFCFNHQPLKAGEEAIMPMTFFIDPQLPKDITYFTLQYTLYDITERLDTPEIVAMNSSLGR
ncbi:cytochrome c oxidase assembly protein [Agaribacter flavus]|uniref:Cytochrome c oxidase assembly protein CtaG n=1 Tax=Agaribacter flavus TaxID=1902781 RepID=A0ABV7FSC5_9ALTE